jgi:hypothetical protein
VVSATHDALQILMSLFPQLKNHNRYSNPTWGGRLAVRTLGCPDFPYLSRLVPRPIRPPVEWVRRLFAPGKTAGAWYWPPAPSSTEVKHGQRYTSTPPLCAFNGVSHCYLYLFLQLKKHCAKWDTPLPRNQNKHFKILLRFRKSSTNC